MVAPGVSGGGGQVYSCCSPHNATGWVLSSWIGGTAAAAKRENCYWTLLRARSASFGSLLAALLRRRKTRYEVGYFGKKREKKEVMVEHFTLCAWFGLDKGEKRDSHSMEKEAGE